MKRATFSQDRRQVILAGFASLVCPAALNAAQLGGERGANTSEARGRLLLLLPLAAAAQELGPEELVRRITNDVLETIRDDKALQAGDRSKALALYEAKVQPHVDFQEAAKLAVGAAWSSANAEQQKRMV